MTCPSPVKSKSWRALEKTFCASGAAWTGLARAGLATGVLFATAAQAQEPPPLFRTIDENGVDLITRELKIDDEILSVGHGAARLKLRMVGNIAGVWHNFDGRAALEEDGNGNWFASAYFEDDKNTFPSVNSPSEQGDGATLAATSTEFIWTRSNGTKVIFDRTITPHGPNFGLPTQIIYPGGHKFEFTTRWRAAPRASNRSPAITATS